MSKNIVKKEAPRVLVTSAFQHTLGSTINRSVYIYIYWQGRGKVEGLISDTTEARTNVHVILCSGPWLNRAAHSSV